MSEINQASKPVVQPETIVGDQVLPERCQIMMANRTQCTRYATKVSASGVKICSVCWELGGAPSNYHDIATSEQVEKKEEQVG